MIELKNMNATSSQDMHAERVLEAVVSRSANSALVASWRRSLRTHRLDPVSQSQRERLTDSELNQARQSIEPILFVAQKALDQLFLAVGGAGCCVVLADRNGILLDRRGCVSDDRTFKSWGLWNGAVWSESREGTNGIGTCIVEHRSLTIHRDEHFLARNSLMSCTTAPIFDHEGNLAAVLDVSSCRAELIENFIKLVSIAVSDAARRIEAKHFCDSFPKSRIVLAPVAKRQSDVLLAVDPNGMIVGASRCARQMLNISQPVIDRALPISKVFAESMSSQDAFIKAERGVLQRALAETGGNVSAAARALGISRATFHRKLKK